jgi:DNA-directed RNA polymerase subunit E'
MFYKLLLKDFVSPDPAFMDDENKLKDNLKEKVKEKYEGFVDKEIGVIISILNIDKINEGIYVPEDEKFYFEVEFEVLSFKPELNEIVYGIIDSVTTFGAFVNIGVIDGLVHMSQLGDNRYEFKDNKIVSIDGKESFKKGDKVKARITAVSYKEEIPKVALTMRQPGLGKLEN